MMLLIISPDLSSMSLANFGRRPYEGVGAAKLELPTAAGSTFSSLVNVCVEGIS